MNFYLFILLSILTLHFKICAQDYQLQKTTIGNARAIELAKQSPLIQSNYEMIMAHVQAIRNENLRLQTLDAISNPKTCVAHRIGITERDKREIIDELKKQNLIDTNEATKFKNGLIEGLFPRLRNEGTPCPQLLQTFQSSPGSIMGDHHAYPGGLVIHEAFALLAAIDLGKNYKKIYGSTNAEGLPVFKSTNDEAGWIDNDVFIAAPLWHDWAKTFVSQWNNDGTIFSELNFGGNGKTDNYGSPGFSVEQGHHILGIAEMMSRKIDNKVIVAVASCHSVPTASEEYKVINWLRTAAIMARIDLQKSGLVYIDSSQKMRLASYTVAENINYTGHKKQHSQMRAEYSLTQLADADWTFTNPAAKEIEALLQILAPEFGFPIQHKSNYFNLFRNPILCFFSSERLSMLYANKGIEGVRNEIAKLKKLGKI